MKTFYKILMERIRGESVRSFERRAGLPLGSVNNWTKGATPSMPAIIRIAAALGEPESKWFQIAKDTRDLRVRPGRSRRNTSYVERV